MSMHTRKTQELAVFNPKTWRKPRARELREREYACEYENPNIRAKIVLRNLTRSNIVLKPTTISKIAVIYTTTNTVMEKRVKIIYNHLKFTLQQYFKRI
jgi:hypothetical protein